jgi:N-acetylneuraminate synthase/N,N'-diacetyllegionaminate synthase
MHTLAETFDVLVGYSDHTDGIEITIGAVALGACVIEKHFTLDRNLPGPDQQASLEIGELKKMVQGIRKIEEAFGTGVKQPVTSELSTASVARKSLYLKNDVPKGHSLQIEDLITMRPGTGISPACMDQVLGRKLKKAIKSGTLLKEDHLA